MFYCLVFNATKIKFGEIFSITNFTYLIFLTYKPTGISPWHSCLRHSRQQRNIAVAIDRTLFLFRQLIKQKQKTENVIKILRTDAISALLPSCPDSVGLLNLAHCCCFMVNMIRNHLPRAQLVTSY